MASDDIRWSKSTSRRLPLGTGEGDLTRREPTAAELHQSMAKQLHGRQVLFLQDYDYISDYKTKLMRGVQCPVTCSYAARAPVLRLAPSRRDNPTPLDSDDESD
jgi:hypothetical protein